MAWQQERLEHNRLARAQRGDEDAFAAAHRALPPRAAAALLPDPRLAPGRRGPAPGDAAGGVARPRAVRGPLLAARVAVHDRHQPLPQRAARPRAPPAGGARRPVRRTATHPESFAEIGWLQPYPDSLLEGVIDVAPGPEAPLRGQGVGGAGLRLRAPAPGAPPARGARAARRARLPRRRGRRHARLQRGLGQQRAAAGAGHARDSGCRPARSAWPSPAAATTRTWSRRFAEAFERDDIDGVVALLTDDAVVSMPPEPEWHQGRDAVERLPARPHGSSAGSRAWRFVAGRRQPPAGRTPTTCSSDGEWVRSGDVRARRAPRRHRVDHPLPRRRAARPLRGPGAAVKRA